KGEDAADAAYTGSGRRRLNNDRRAKLLLLSDWIQASGYVQSMQTVNVAGYGVSDFLSARHHINRFGVRIDDWSRRDAKLRLRTIVTNRRKHATWNCGNAMGGIREVYLPNGSALQSVRIECVQAVVFGRHENQIAISEL